MNPPTAEEQEQWLARSRHDSRHAGIIYTLVAELNEHLARARDAGLSLTVKLALDSGVDWSAPDLNKVEIFVARPVVTLPSTDPLQEKWHEILESGRLQVSAEPPTHIQRPQSQSEQPQ